MNSPKPESCALVDLPDEWFAVLPWPAQSEVIAELNRMSARCEGKTEKEANVKRAPIDKAMGRFVSIHDAQFEAYLTSRFTRP